MTDPKEKICGFPVFKNFTLAQVSLHVECVLKITNKISRHCPDIWWLPTAWGELNEYGWARTLATWTLNFLNWECPVRTRRTILNNQLDNQPKDKIPKNKLFLLNWFWISPIQIDPHLVDRLSMSFLVIWNRTCQNKQPIGICPWYLWKLSFSWQSAQARANRKVRKN